MGGSLAAAALFLAVGTAIALIRLRTSPLYPAFNDVNSDIYVFAMVGNSWTYGLLPYRDVYDVKGPFLYLLFGLFAKIQPWSMGPPLAFLALLASSSVWLAYAIARLHRLGRPLAVVAAVGSCSVIYLGVADVNTSFTCEEIAVPGVLLMLWLVLRWLRNGDRIPAAWWVVDGFVVGALFWTKYQVIAPWAAMLVGLVIVTVRGGLAPRALGRMIGWNLLGAAVATAGVLAATSGVIADMATAYFLAKRNNFKPAGELPAQAAWVLRSLTENTAASVVLIGVLVVLIIAAVRGRPAGLPFLIAFALSLWASAVVVRHPNNFFVPLSFVPVAVAQVLSVAQSRGRIWSQVAAVGGLVATVVIVAGPLIEGVRTCWLLGRPKPMTCTDLVTGERSTRRAQVSTVFAEAAGYRPILSVGTLFAARTSFISRQPARQPFQFVDASWVRTIGADQVQRQYLLDRTFDYAWIHFDELDPARDLEDQILGSNLRNSRTQPDQTTALVRNYVPVLRCNDELLLSARGPAPALPEQGS